MPIILSQMLEAYRWIGALLVLSAHSTNLFLSLHDIMTAPHAPPVYVWWFAASFEFGHQAVLGFFVMSGYLVGGSVLASIRKQKIFARIFDPPLRAHLCRHRPCAHLDLHRRRLAATSCQHLFLRSAAVRGPFQRQRIHRNVLNFQEIFTVTYGTNSPLWSLACEFWYYVTFRCSCPLRATIPTGSATRFRGRRRDFSVAGERAVVSLRLRALVIGALASLRAGR